MKLIDEIGGFSVHVSEEAFNEELKTFPKCYRVLNTETNVLEYETLHLFAVYKYIYDATLQEAGWKKAIKELMDKSGDSLLLPNQDILVPGPYGPQ